MIRGYSLGSPFKPLTSSGLRLGLALIITLMVISSPIFMLVNPVSASSSLLMVVPSVPSTISQDGSDFSTQSTLVLFLLDQQITLSILTLSTMSYF